MDWRRERLNSTQKYLKPELIWNSLRQFLVLGGHPWLRSWWSNMPRVSLAELPKFLQSQHDVYTGSPSQYTVYIGSVFYVTPLVYGFYLWRTPLFYFPKLSEMTFIDKRLILFVMYVNKSLSCQLLFLSVCMHIIMFFFHIYKEISSAHV